MTTVDVSDEGTAGDPPVRAGEMKLESVVLLQEITTRAPGR